MVPEHVCVCVCSLCLVATGTAIKIPLPHCNYKPSVSQSVRLAGCSFVANLQCQFRYHFTYISTCHYSEIMHYSTY